MQTERTFIDDLKHQYKYGGMTIRLIFANVIVYLIISILGVVARLSGGEFGAMVASFTENLFTLQTDIGDFVTHPWGLFTSIFAHFSFFHILMNMIFLYFAGRMFEQMFDQKRLFYTYLVGGILGGIFEIIAGFFPTIAGHQVVGASGSIMAIFIALAFHRPNMKVNLFGVLPVRLIILAAIFFLKDLLNLGTNDGTAHFAHLGGAVLGMISVQQIHSPNNIINRVQQLGDWILRLFAGNKQRKMKVKRPKSNTRMKTDEEYNVDSKSKQEQTDRILDKISKSGYDSLTKKEKDFLFKQSNNG